MVQGFPKRVPPKPAAPAPAPRVEFKPAPPPTVPLDEIEYDEDGGRLVKAPLAPANVRPPPTTTPPPSLRMPPPPPPRPAGNTNVRPTRPAGWKPPLDFSKQQAAPPPPPKPPAPKVSGPWKPRALRPGERILLNPDDIPY
jgi:hypothetical protein